MGAQAWARAHSDSKSGGKSESSAGGVEGGGSSGRGKRTCLFRRPTSLVCYSTVREPLPASSGGRPRPGPRRSGGRGNGRGATSPLPEPTLPPVPQHRRQKWGEQRTWQRSGAGQGKRGNARRAEEGGNGSVRRRQPCAAQRPFPFRQQQCKLLAAHRRACVGCCAAAVQGWGCSGATLQSTPPVRSLALGRVTLAIGSVTLATPASAPVVQHLGPCSTLVDSV